MTSMNNWLTFSLSPQDLPPSESHQSHSPSADVSHLISGDDVSTNYFGLSADSTSEPPMGIPTLRTDASFGIIEAFNRFHHQTQDWDIKSLDFKGSSSELSMLVGSSSNQHNMEGDVPKLEDFLGGNSPSDHDPKVLPAGLAGACNISNDEYVFSNPSFQVQDTSVMTLSAHGGAQMNNANGGCSSNSIGLSTIKTWLRNQPNPQQQVNNSSNDIDGARSGINFDSAKVTNVIGSLTNSQSLSLSMSTGSRSSSALPLLATGVSVGGESSSSDNKQKGINGGSLDSHIGATEAVPRKSVNTFGQRTSIYRGVTRHRWTGRYEAHLWDNSCRREGQTRKGRQVYLGGYDKEEKAARAYDLAALKYWGPTTTTNFPTNNYEKELEEMKHMTRQEFIASLRRKSSGFSRGASIYRGVTRHHHHGRWQARIGRVAGNKDLYLGTFSTQEEAAEAYDIAAIKFRGLNAVTNFDMSRYDVKSILESNTLPVVSGGAAKRFKDVSDHAEAASVIGRRADESHLMTSQFDVGMMMSSYGPLHHRGWPSIGFHWPQPLGVQYDPYGQPRGWTCKQEQDAVVTATHGLQDLHQLHLGTNAHKSCQPNSSVLLHGLVGIDSSSSLEHSTGSNSVIYNDIMGGGHVMPMSTVVTDHDNQGKQVGCDSMLMNAYCFTQQPSSGIAKASGFEKNNTCWMPASAQAVASRSNSMAVGHGASLFTVWNDA